MSKKFNFITNNQDLFHIYIYVPAGSIYEQEKKRGISHLLEHMLLKHTKKYTEHKLLKEITALGGTYNAATDRDVTFYYIMTHMDNYIKTIDIMKSVITEPVFTQYELDMERKVVIEEIKKRLDSDIDLYNLSYLTILSKNNKYSKPIEGYEHTIKNIELSDLHDYFKEHYKNFMIFINCDKKILNHVEKYVIKLFGENSALNFDEISTMYKSIGYESSLYVIDREYQQYSTHIMFPSFPRSMYKENIILNFIRYCLISSGLYSILAYELRSKRGLIYDISGMNEIFRYIGIFRIIISTSSNQTDFIIGLIIDCLLRIKKNGFPSKILDYYKKSFISQQKYALTNNEYKTIMHAEDLFYGMNHEDKEYMNILDEINNDDIIRIAIKVFDLNKLGILTYGNYKNKGIKRRILEMIKTYNILETN